MASPLTGASALVSLEKVKDASAYPKAGILSVPLKITSSIFVPRSDFTDCSPSTQRMESAIFDFPQPLGPTTAVMPGSKCKVVFSAKDLNPNNSNFLKYIIRSSFSYIKPLINSFTLKPPLADNLGGRDLLMPEPLINRPRLHFQVTRQIIYSHQRILDHIGLDFTIHFYRCQVKFYILLHLLTLRCNNYPIV